MQLKFSAVQNRGKQGGLTIPANGMGGDWIVKLPSARHPDVPENEFAAMSLARMVGVDVPDIDLLPLDAIAGLPTGIARYGASAYAIRRFGRTHLHVTRALMTLWMDLAVNAQLETARNVGGWMKGCTVRGPGWMRPSSPFQRRVSTATHSMPALSTRLGDTIRCRPKR